VTVEFDDAAVADFFDEQVDQGRRPEEFSRIWLHTHPGASAQPSHTDEETTRFLNDVITLLVHVNPDGNDLVAEQFRVAAGERLSLQPLQDLRKKKESFGVARDAVNHRVRPLLQDAPKTHIDGQQGQGDPIRSIGKVIENRRRGTHCKNSSNN